MFKVFIMGILSNLGLLSILNRKGEAGAEGKEANHSAGEKLLTQAQVDAIVQDRLAREKGKYADYEDLRKFKTEHEKMLEDGKQKEMEAKQEYEKLKESWNSKQQELTNMIANKDNEIKDMRTSNILMGEITKQNAYAEETMALIKSQAVFDKDNNLRIKGRDANGLEVLHSVEEGIKQFLTQRPHLVKVQSRAGGGTPQGGTGGAGAGVQDLNTLNGELQAAMHRGDRKAINEIKTKISAVRGARHSQF